MLPISANDKYDAAKLEYKYFLARNPHKPCILLISLLGILYYAIQKDVN